MGNVKMILLPFTHKVKELNLKNIESLLNVYDKDWKNDVPGILQRLVRERK